MKKQAVLLILTTMILVSFPRGIRSENADTLMLRLAGTREDTSRVNLLLKLVSIYLNTNPRKAESYISKAISVSEQIKYPRGIANSNYYLALLFKDSDVGLSEQLVEKALDAAKKTGDQKLMAKILNLTGVIYTNSKPADQVLYYFNKALVLELSAPDNSDSTAAVYIQNIGRIYLEQNKNVLARQYFSKAIEFAVKNNSKRRLLYPYMNIGWSFVRDGNFDSGLYYYMLSLNNARQIQFNRILPDLYNNLSDFYKLKGDSRQTVYYARLALEASIANLNLEEKGQALNTLYTIYLKLGNVDTAITYLQQYTSTKDSIFKNRQLHTADLAELKYKFQNNQIINELKIKRQRTLIYIFVLLVLLMLASGFSLFYILKLKNRQKQFMIDTLVDKNKGLETEIIFKSQELTNNLLMLAQRNELISDVIHKLQDMQRSTPGELPIKINASINELKFNLKSDIWDLFEKEFMGVHPDFFDKLSKRYPDLTQKEKRLCALLRLNLNTKEISEISHLNNESVTKARTRLRKRFNLTNVDTNLTSFLSQF